MNALPPWLGCAGAFLVLWVLAPGCLTLGLYLGFLYGDRAKALTMSIASSQALRALIADGVPILLYLRPFASERRDRMPLTAPYTEDVEADIQKEERESDMARELLPVLRGRIRRIEFLNPISRYGAHCDLAIDMLALEWFNEFAQAARAACVIIVGSGDGEDRSEFRREVEFLVSEGLLPKTLVMVNRFSRLLSIYPALSDARWIVHGPASAACFPPDFLRFIDSTHAGLPGCVPR